MALSRPKALHISSKLFIINKKGAIRYVKTRFPLIT